MKKKLFLAAALIAVAAVFTACSKDDDDKHFNLKGQQPVDLSKITGNYEAKDGDILKGTLAGIYTVSVADGATVTLDNAAINGTHGENYKWAGLTCNGTATIILKGKNNIKGFCNGYPGIGGGPASSCGNITISGGTVNASADELSTGFVGSEYSTCGDITITNTVTSVTAKKGNGAPNSIGAGDQGTCGTVTIGGTVYAGGIAESPYTYQPSH